MPPTMTTRSAGRPAAASRRGGTGGRAGSGGGRTRGRSGDQGNGRDDGPGGQVGGQGSEVNGGADGVPDLFTIIAQQLQNLLPTIVAQVGDQSRGQGNGRNQNGDAVHDNIQDDVSRGCTYKEFLACNPKEYDGKGGAIVFTRWIETMESVQDMSGPGGKGHGSPNLVSLGDIKNSGLSSGKNEHKFPKVKSLGNIKNSGPSLGGKGHGSPMVDSLGSIKNSGPSPGGKGHGSPMLNLLVISKIPDQVLEERVMIFPLMKPLAT
ncbi:hypothetical protein Tco_0561550 [Tanacetum coccineum]